MLILDAINLPFAEALNLNGFVYFLFVFCFIAVMGFEFVNGFHDTANAVATVIYTKTLKPYPAILWSGICNFLGVLVIGTAVAMSLLKVVPLDHIVGLPVTVGACLVIAVLLSSILWNVGTWYIGIPLSSSHTLIGALIGASLGFSYYYGGGVNWEQAKDIGLSLLISPLLGFVLSYLLMQGEKRVIKTDRFFHVPENDEDKPPFAIRCLLVTTCTLVSFFHGSNDGQKGVGLLMLVLTAFVPAKFALNQSLSDQQIVSQLNSSQQAISKAIAYDKQKAGKLTATIEALKSNIGKKHAANARTKFNFREQMQTAVKGIKDVSEDKKTPEDVKKTLKANAKGLQKATDLAPIWVILVISLSLGFGTMIGWKRIVVTVGEHIGNRHLNYAEGATAEIVAAATIGLSTGLGLPVSTTHVLSSGVAGTMTALDGKKGLNYATIKHIALAWLLTLPAAIILSFLFFVLFHLFLK